jgi:hypothetical protein
MDTQREQDIRELAELYRLAQASKITASPDKVLGWAATRGITLNDLEGAR